jgi:hypothetical protein
VAISTVVRALSNAATFVKLTYLRTPAPDVWIGDVVGQLVAAAVGVHVLIEEGRDFVLLGVVCGVLK